MAQREEPVLVPAKSPASDPSRSAAIIFVHGLSDDGHGFEDVARQFQAHNKLPYMQWIFPNAMENRDVRERAWYAPTGLTPFPPSRPELEEDEDEDGLLQSRKYLVSLIDDLVEKQGVPPNRIVFGGFSQGCAMTLLVGLTSKYAGKLAGLAGTMGYLPLANKMTELREDSGLTGDIGEVPMFLIRGKRDMLVPKRYFTICTNKLAELGYKEDLIETHEYEGMGHTLGGAALRDLCTWLERVLPPLEEK